MATAIDAYDRPVSENVLPKKLATTASRFNNPFAISNRFVAGLIPIRLRNILTEADGGQNERLLILAEEMIERDGNFGSLMQTRTHRVLQLVRKVVAASDKRKDVKVMDDLTKLVKSYHFQRAMQYLHYETINKGYGVLEIIWGRKDGKWVPVKLKPVDAFMFAPAPDEPQGLMLRTGDDLSKLVPLDPMKFIVHRYALKGEQFYRGGVCRPISFTYMYKTMGLTDMAGFSERYAMPIPVGSYPAGTEKGDLGTYRAALEFVNSDGAILKPEGMTLEFMTPGAHGSEQIYLNQVAYWEKVQAKIVLGQTMTSEDGSSLAQAQVHERTEDRIVATDGEDLAATLHNDLLLPYVFLNYASINDLPQLEISFEKKEDLAGFTASFLPWVEKDVTVEKSVIRDKFGVPEPKEGADVVGAAAAADVQPEEDENGNALGQNEDQTNQDGKPSKKKNRETSPELNTAEVNTSVTERTLWNDPLEQLMRSLYPSVRKAARPMVESVMVLASNSQTEDEFLSSLEQVASTGEDEFAEAMMAATYAAREAGEAIDPT